MSSDSKVILFEELAKHNHKNDCWLLINGKVYDVTSFLDDHPGGDEVLLTAAEKDATNEFEDVGHSDSAREMMGKYYIGEIDASSIPKEHVQETPSATPGVVNQPNRGSDFMIKILQFLVPLLILGVAFALRSSIKKEE